MADNDEAILLRRRARRRLVGAIALVVAAVIVLPIVFDKEPKPISQDIVIQIPSQNSGRFNNKVLPPPEIIEEQSAANAIAVKPEEAKSKPIGNVPENNDLAANREIASKGDAAKSAASKAPIAAKDLGKSTEAVSGAEAEAARAQAALQGEAYVVPLGAFLNQANVRTLQAKVTAAGFKSYSEVQKLAKGDQIRVRAGPFPTRQAAEEARESLQNTGLTVGPVTKL
ncbi:MAG: SPOR domain-containing protein [Burkholderiales bacterium]